MRLSRTLGLIIAGCAAVLAAYSCVKPEREDKVADYLESVEIKDDPNALRIPFSFKFLKDCCYSVEYWQKDNPDVCGTTRTFESKGCRGEATVMFLYPKTRYEYRICITNGAGKVFRTETAEFITGSLPIGIPEYSLLGTYPDTEIPGYIFQWQATEPGYVVFCDTDGIIVWYEVLEMAARQVTFDPQTGTISMLLGFKTSQSDPTFQRWCKKIVVMDLEGHRYVDEEASQDTIEFPHHEIKRMPDGNIAILHGVAKTFDLTPIGGEPNTTIYGEGITILTPEMEKVWTWDCFEELDPIRDEYLDAVVRKTDLIHANSVAWDAEGNIYMTVNFLSELWKIDRKTGKVLYRVGDYGNMALAPEDHASGLHSAEPLAPDKVLCFDNGSDRGISRAVIYEVDTAQKTAKVTLSVPIPEELSSRDRSNVVLSQDGSMLFFGSTMGYANIFTDLSGNVLKVVKRTKISYRSYYFETVEY